MLHVVIRISGDCSLGIEFTYSVSLGLLVIKSLPAAIASLQTGDTIESISGVLLEPSDWEDAVWQLRDALAPGAESREIRFVRNVEVGAPAQMSTTTTWSLTKPFIGNRLSIQAFGAFKDKSERSCPRDHRFVPSEQMQGKHGPDGVGAEFIKALRKKREEEVRGHLH